MHSRPHAQRLSAECSRASCVVLHHALCVTDGCVVWAWGLNVSGALGLDVAHAQEALQAELAHLGGADGTDLRSGLVPLQWPADLCNGSPVQMVACRGSTRWCSRRRARCGPAEQGATDRRATRACPGQCASARVAGLPAVALVAAGDTFSAAVGTDGQVWMWGNTVRGRLGYLQAVPHTMQEAAPRSLGLGAFGQEKAVLLSLRAGSASAVTERGTLWV